MNARIIDCHQAFVFGNGNTARHYYHRDGIHLNANGTSALVTAINQQLPITRHGSGKGSVNEHPQILLRLLTDCDGNRETNARYVDCEITAPKTATKIDGAPAATRTTMGATGNTEDRDESWLQR
ncbi:hypothetical protein DPMN_065763 [Dreissena polymorpha]|uniref:Uncharacterized protein n=1 Tax=Dreissena polymorpha TaxID=45954 RepID=A0A9D3YX30_DREPO|nr:hypothetical protein DPMN_065763 [Dreissena polymorpha]